MGENIDINSYIKIFENIKKEVLKSQYKAIQAVNAELIYMYWNIGKIIIQNAKWGNKFIDNLSVDLKIEFPAIKGFSIRNLKNMKKFAEEYSEFEFVQSATAQITWTHNILLIDKVKDIKIRKWYINETAINGWSVKMLEMQIDSMLYERQAVAEKSTNFKNTLSEAQGEMALQTIKDPYVFDFIALKGKVRESEIENAMIDKIKEVLLELGNGFAFVGNQYKLTVGNKDYFVDLLFYHLKLECYIVVELKTREFEPADVGQLNFYLSAIDDLVKNEKDNPSIGLLLCKTKDKFTVEYALKDVNKPIGVSGYKLLEDIPEYLQSQLPRSEDINLHIRTAQ